MIEPYEKKIFDDLEKIQKGCNYNLKNINCYPQNIACEILKKLLEWACQPQNSLAIELARNKINEINKDWLKRYFLEVASICIDYSDEWEYRRLVELVFYAIPQLKQEVLKLGERSENEEVREVIEDFQNL